MTQSSMFFTEPEPPRAQCIQVAEGIQRIVANNPGKMTYHGTNTYIVDTSEGRFIIDSGRVEDSLHLDAIIDSLGPNPAGILVTHHHSDHFGAAPILRERTGLPVYVSQAFPDDAFQPDAFLEDGEVIAGLTVLHTPGHVSDHLCFARPDRVLFTGDHIMSWNSSIVSPPDGNMHDYCAHLKRLIERDDKICLPGHGPVLPHPQPYAKKLLANRMRREAEILEHLADTPDTVKNTAALFTRNPIRILRWPPNEMLRHILKSFSQNREWHRMEIS